MESQVVWFGFGILFFSGLLFTSCMTAEVFRTDVELDALDLEYDDTLVSGKFTIHDVQVERTGVRASFGDVVRGYAQAYAETFDEDYDGYGAGIGAVGEPPIGQLGENVDLILPFAVGVNYTNANTDFTVPLLGKIETDIWYLEAEGEVGLGVDVQGIQPSVGVYVSSIVGRWDGKADIGKVDLDVTGENAGYYLNLQYRGGEVPLMVRLRALGGDVRGVMVGVGIVF